MLIQDHPVNGNHEREILALSNFDVVVVRNAEEAFVAAIKGAPHLVVCDLSSPDADAPSLLRALQSGAALRNVPVIVVTSDTSKGSVRRIMGLGADDCLVRPFEGIELLRAVDACVERRERLLTPARPVSSGMASTPAGEESVWHPEDQEPRGYKKRCILYTEGQRALQVWYIVDGKIKTYLVHGDGKELITGIYGAGDCVGYAAAISGGVHSDNAQVLEDAQLIAIPRAEFLRLLENDGTLARQIVRWLAHRSGDKDAGLLNFAYSSLRKKVANGILSLAANGRLEQAGRRYISISRENLAAFVGSAPESLTRTLGDFRKEGLINIADGRIWLLNEDKLRKMLN